MKLSIKNRGGCTVLRLSFLIVLLTFGFSPARAQDLVRTPAESSEPNVAERVRQLESELERQNLKLDQLQKTLMEQQSTIQALLEKLSQLLRDRALRQRKLRQRSRRVQKQ